MRRQPPSNSFWLRLSRWLNGFTREAWPDGQPVMIGGLRVGTRFDNGSVRFAPGYSATPTLCSGCQKAIQPEEKQRPAADAERHTEEAGAPLVAGHFESGTEPHAHRVIDPLANTEKQQT
jgi:hypothetical protein